MRHPRLLSRQFDIFSEHITKPTLSLFSFLKYLNWVFIRAFDNIVIL